VIKPLPRVVGTRTDAFGEVNHYFWRTA
jgi:hypothetical protein